MFAVSDEENLRLVGGRKRKSNRRSSILKIPKSPTRNVLEDLDPNSDAERTTNLRRASRRVSFAQTCSVKEFVPVSKQTETPWLNAELEREEKEAGSSTAESTSSSVSVSGLQMLMTGAIENNVMLGSAVTESQPSSADILRVPMSDGFDVDTVGTSNSDGDTVSSEILGIGISCAKNVNMANKKWDTPSPDRKIDSSDFLQKMIRNSENRDVSSLLYKPEPRFKAKSSREIDAKMNACINKYQCQSIVPSSVPKSADKTVMFGDSEGDMEITQALWNDMLPKGPTSRRSFANATWANESTRVFNKSMDLTQFVNVEFEPAAPSSDVYDQTQLFGDAGEGMELTMALTGDLSLGNFLEDLNKIDTKSFLERLDSNKNQEPNEQKVDTVGFLSSLGMKTSTNLFSEETSRQQIDTRSFLSSLSTKKQSSEDSKNVDSQTFKGKHGINASLLTKTVEEKIDTQSFLSKLGGATALETDLFDESILTSAPSEKIDSNAFLSKLVGEEPETVLRDDVSLAGNATGMKSRRDQDFDRTRLFSAYDDDNNMSMTMCVGDASAFYDPKSATLQNKTVLGSENMEMTMVAPSVLQGNVSNESKNSFGGKVQDKTVMFNETHTQGADMDFTCVGTFAVSTAGVSVDNSANKNVVSNFNQTVVEQEGMEFTECVTNFVNIPSHIQQEKMLSDAVKMSNKTVLDHTSMELTLYPKESDVDEIPAQTLNGTKCSARNKTVLEHGDMELTTCAGGLASQDGYQSVLGNKSCNLSKQEYFGERNIIGNDKTVLFDKDSGSAALDFTCVDTMETKPATKQPRTNKTIIYDGNQTALGGGMDFTCIDSAADKTRIKDKTLNFGTGENMDFTCVERNDDCNSENKNKTIYFTKNKDGELMDFTCMESGRSSDGVPSNKTIHYNSEPSANMELTCMEDRTSNTTKLHQSKPSRKSVVFNLEENTFHGGELSLLKAQAQLAEQAKQNISGNGHISTASETNLSSKPGESVDLPTNNSTIDSSASLDKSNLAENRYGAVGSVSSMETTHYTTMESGIETSVFTNEDEKTEADMTCNTTRLMALKERLCRSVIGSDVKDVDVSLLRLNKTVGGDVEEGSIALTDRLAPRTTLIEEREKTFSEELQVTHQEADRTRHNSQADSVASTDNILDEQPPELLLDNSLQLPELECDVVVEPPKQQQDAKNIGVRNSVLILDRHEQSAVGNVSEIQETGRRFDSCSDVHGLSYSVMELTTATEALPNRSSANLSVLPPERHDDLPHRSRTKSEISLVEMQALEESLGVMPNLSTLDSSLGTLSMPQLYDVNREKEKSVNAESMSSKSRLGDDVEATCLGDDEVFKDKSISRKRPSIETPFPEDGETESKKLKMSSSSSLTDSDSEKSRLNCTALSSKSFCNASMASNRSLHSTSLMPKLTLGESIISHMSQIETYDVSQLNLEAIDDYLGLFNVHFIEKNQRRSTMVPMSVKQPETVSEILSQVVYEPQVGTYEWACEQLEKRIDIYRSKISETEKEMLQNLPDIFRNTPGDEETTKQLLKLKSTCRKKAEAEFKEWKNKMLVSISSTLKEEDSAIKQGLDEVSVLISELQEQIHSMQQERCDLEKREEEVNKLSEKLPLVNEIKEKQTLMERLEKKCKELEKESIEQTNANFKLDEKLKSVQQQIENLDESLEKRNDDTLNDLKEQLRLLKDSSFVDVYSWTEEEVVLTFLQKTLVLKIKFGESIPVDWFPKHNHYVIKEISFHSLLKETSSKSVLLAHKIALARFPSDSLLNRCPDTRRLSKLIHSISSTLCDARQLVWDIEQDGLGDHHKTEIELEQNRVRTTFSSMKCRSYFDLVFKLDLMQFPVVPMDWEARVLFGPIKNEDIRKRIESVDPGHAYIRRILESINELVNDKIAEASKTALLSDTRLSHI